MREYLEQVSSGEGDVLDVLPYLGLIRRQLGDVAIVGVGEDDDEATEICSGILAEKLEHPCFLELIDSYWRDEAGLVTGDERHQLAVPEPHPARTRTRPAARPGHRPAAPAQQPAVGPGAGPAAPAHHRAARLRVRPPLRAGALRQARAAGARRRLAVEVHGGVPQPAGTGRAVHERGRRHDPHRRRLPRAERAQGDAPAAHRGGAQPVRRPAVDGAARDADVRVDPVAAARCTTSCPTRKMVAYAEPWIGSARGDEQAARAGRTSR